MVACAASCRDMFPPLAPSLCCRPKTTADKRQYMPVNRPPRAVSSGNSLSAAKGKTSEGFLSTAIDAVPATFLPYSRYSCSRTNPSSSSTMDKPTNPITPSLDRCSLCSSFCSSGLSEIGRREDERGGEVFDRRVSDSVSFGVLVVKFGSPCCGLLFKR